MQSSKTQGNSDDLIFDIGMHKGEDTDYYLKKGYKVVAVDADPNLINEVRDKYKPYIESGRLILENCAISNEEKDIEFYISEHSIYSSLHEKISNRQNFFKESILVPSKTLDYIFRKYGKPLYCKIDIEGYDYLAIRTIDETNRPKFISAESECLGQDEIINLNKSLEVLNELKAKGYDRFKLIDQKTLSALKPNGGFYRVSFMKRIQKKVNAILGIKRHGVVDKALNYHFVRGSSGPFGENTPGKWYDYGLAVKTLVKNRAEYFDTEGAFSYGFWCDWHAKVEKDNR